jgi:beta-glucosidase
MAAWYLTGQDQDFPETSFSSWTLNTQDYLFYGGQRGFGVVNEHIDVRANHADINRGLLADSIIVLKNFNNTLPLVKPKQIGVFGSDAGPAINGPNGFVDRGSFQMRKV